MLDYLSRYTHRTAIGNERLLGIEGDAVCLRVRVNAGRRGRGGGGGSGRTDGAGRAGNVGGKWVITVPGVQFIGRLMQHVLPTGFKRIRHFGLLAPAAKAQRLATARPLLAMPPANPALAEAVRAFMQRVAGIDILRCPHCTDGRWRVLACLAPTERTACQAAPRPAPSPAPCPQRLPTMSTGPP